MSSSPILESRELRQIADHLEQLCIESHQRRVKTVACDGCKSKATKLRDYAAALDQATQAIRKTDVVNVTGADFKVYRKRWEEPS